jgi:hypothetical protein
MTRPVLNGCAARSGTLRIGDQWNAINIIARSQTHPLKAVCELVENAIDAQAEQIEITRRRSQGHVYLEIADSGNGIQLNAAGEPDFARIATHVCDSMKRNLAGTERRGVHGEFGIGLLSFWSLGQSLRMISGGTGDRLLEMELQAGKKNYVIRPARGQLALGGTRVIVGPLSEAARKVVTGEKLVRYLSAELRDRIRASGVVIQVIDRLIHKQLVVRPQEFVGERIACDETIATSYGPLRVELYFRERVDGPAEGIAVCKDGTRVLRSLTELDVLQHSPWTESALEGVLDYPAFELAPGTRSGIVPDGRFNIFLAAVEELEPVVLRWLETRQRVRAEKASLEILRQLKKAFTSALRELPPSEYLFFDLPKQQDKLAANDGGRQNIRDIDPGVILRNVSSAPPESPGLEPGPASQDFLPHEPGPLCTVIIVPKHPRAQPGQECALRAMPLDEYGQPTVGQLVYGWRIVEGDGVLHGAEEICRVSSPTAGIVVVEVDVSDGSTTAQAQTPVKFFASQLASDANSPQGLPTYRIFAEQGQPWRSRYDAQRNEIVINSAHRDFAASRAPMAKHRRYIGKLYAKEVVLINFPHEPPGTAMERLIELTLRTEESL